MKLIKSTLIAAALLAAGAALAQPGPGAHQPGERIISLLNLDANRAAQVTAIMTEAKSQRQALRASMKGKRGDPAAREAARDQMHTIGENTKARLAQVLTPAEMAKLKEAHRGLRH